MVITAQPFFQELDMLELKFRELEGVVDLHVVVEAPFTYTGIPKPLHFRDNAERFRHWPVKYVIADIPYFPPAAGPWPREQVNRLVVDRVVREVNPDIVMWLDTDECPRPGVVEEFRSRDCDLASLEMDYLLMRFDRIDTSQKWPSPKITRGRFDAPDRNLHPGPIIRNAGWHFVCFGEKDFVIRKLMATSHAPEPGQTEFRRMVQADERPCYWRTARNPLDRLPMTVQRDPQKYAAYFDETPL